MTSRKVACRTLHSSGPMRHASPGEPGVACVFLIILVGAALPPGGPGLLGPGLRGETCTMWKGSDLGRKHGGSCPVGGGLHGSLWMWAGELACRETGEARRRRAGC